MNNDCQNQVAFKKQVLSYVYERLLPLEVSLQLKIFPKKFTKTSLVKMIMIPFSIADACLL